MLCSRAKTGVYYKSRELIDESIFTLKSEFRGGSIRGRLPMSFAFLRQTALTQILVYRVHSGFRSLASLNYSLLETRPYLFLLSVFYLVKVLISKTSRFLNSTKQKEDQSNRLTFEVLGNVLLSQGETPNYHRRSSLTSDELRISASDCTLSNPRVQSTLRFSLTCFLELLAPRNPTIPFLIICLNHSNKHIS